MGVFDFLFGSKLTIERLVKLDENELQEDLKKRNIRDLQKFCLKGCQNLNNEEKQKEVYINAILQFIHEKKIELENSQMPENMKNAIEDSVSPKPVELNNEMPPEQDKPVVPEPEPEPVPEPMAAPMEPPKESSEYLEEEGKVEEKPRGGKKESKKKGGRTRRKKEKVENVKKGGKKRNSKKK
jgi:hypothetical protein